MEHTNSHESSANAGHIERLKPASHRRRRAGLCAGIFWCALAIAPRAHADDPVGSTGLPSLGLSPGDPQQRSVLPTSPFARPPHDSHDWVLDFHGYVLLPFNSGWHKREDPEPGQSATTIHTPPLIPQDLRSFGYTGVIPTTWVQLDFTYGNSVVSATTILAARTLTDAAGFYNPVDQLGVNDAYLDVNLSGPLKLPLELKVGAFTGRYGAMGQWDAGRYGTPLIAQTNSIGEQLNGAFKIGKTTIVVEQGVGGQVGRPPTGIVPEGWNDFADTGVGASFVNHLHVGLGYADTALLGVHYLTAWSQDDQASHDLIPDGRITVLGADARFTAGRLGHLYLGAARTKATNSATVAGVIEVLNARGGPELISEYLGPNSNGDGTLTTLGGQYDLSLSRLVYGDRFKGNSPDVMVSLFGVSTHVSSKDKDFDGVNKVKAGAEVTYGMLSWLGVSARLDRVAPNTQKGTQSYTIISPRLLLHTDWYSRDEFVLQYSRFTYGKNVVVDTGFPPMPDPSANPDRDVVSLSGTFWW
jgi:hypothetical protein